MTLERFKFLREIGFVLVQNQVSSGEELAYVHQTSNEDGIMMEGCRLTQVYDDTHGGPSMLMLRAWHWLD